MKHFHFLKRLWRCNNRSIILMGLLFFTVPVLFGLEPVNMKIQYVENTDRTAGIYYSYIIPDNILYPVHTLPGSISFTTNSGNGSSLQQMDLLRVTRIKRDRQAFLMSVNLWSWITLGSFGINCGIIVLAVLTGEPEIGALSMISHAWFAVSNTFLGNAYYKLNRSLYTYGPEGKNTYFGMSTAYGAVVFAVIGIGIGATMFDRGPTEPGIIGTSVAAGLSNLLGLSAFMYYLFLDKSF